MDRYIYIYDKLLHRRTYKVPGLVELRGDIKNYEYLLIEFNDFGQIIKRTLRLPKSLINPAVIMLEMVVSSWINNNIMSFYLIYIFLYS